MNNTVVFITALRLEYEAVTAYLEGKTEYKTPDGTVYETGEYLTPDGKNWRVFVAETGDGSDSAAIETERLLQRSKATYAFFVGIAGGLKDDVKIGHVVAAHTVNGYEKAKIAKDTSLLSRVDSVKCDYSLEQHARATRRNEKWVSKILGFDRQTEEIPVAHVAPIVTGGKVIASTKSEVYKSLKNQQSDAVAVEMEGLGFLKAVRANRSVMGIVIRGISDMCTKGRANDKMQPIAARNAAAFAFAMLDRLESKQFVLSKLSELEEYRKHFSEEDMTILRREVFLKYF